MNQRFRVSPAGLLLALVTAIGPVYAADNTATTVKQLNEAWNAAFNNQDAVALAGLYAEKAVVSPGNGKVLRGREAIQAQFQGFFDNGLHDHSIEIIESHRDGDMIYEVARWQVHGQAEAGAERPVYGGVLVSHFRRNDAGEWQSVSHVWNMRQ